MKQSIVFVICVFALWSISANSGPQNVELRLSVDGTIEINPEGRVHDYAIETRLAPAIRDHIDQRVRQWRFEPVTDAGRTVVAKSRMRLEMLALPNGENYQLRVDDVLFGVSRNNRVEKMPRYPQEALRARLGARVVVAVRTDAEGRVVDVRPYQTSLTQRRAGGRSDRTWRLLFEKAVTDTVMHWVYEPGEYVDGKSTESARIVPVVFQITGGRKEQRAAGWQAYISGPVTPTPWQSMTQYDEDQFGALKENESLVMNPRFRLIDDVVGRML